MSNERLNLEMTGMDVLMAMSGGNPDALTVCMQLMQNGAIVDPDSFEGGLGSIMMLDTLGIYEDRIWMLYKDVCDHHLGKMIAVLRAYQLGQLAGVNTENLNHAIDNYGKGLNLEAVVSAVTEQLPNFQPEAAAA